MSVTILAIESSCDETSAAVVQNGKVLNNIIATQSVHEKYGGVVPELASRAHQINIVPVVDQALKEANVKPGELSAIAFTRGPGLLGALLVGTSFAKGLAMSLDIPLIEVNHMQAHVLAHFIQEPKPTFPFLCLTVSGGHTQIVMVQSPLDMEIIGETIDDAVGEAFDKSAKILNLPYPGGPLIDKYAAGGDPQRFTFPETDIEGYNFSFSGIKTAILYFIRDELKKDQAFIDKNIKDICASIQRVLVAMLMKKLIKAADDLNIMNIAIAGGVSANSSLRKQLLATANEKKWNTFIPEFEYCTDNAAMIAMAAYFKYIDKKFTEISVSPDPRMKF